MILTRVLSFTAALLSVATIAGAQDVGVSDDRVDFVQIAALDGPAARLGLGMQKGILAAFKEINDAGGVSGR